MDAFLETSLFQGLAWDGAAVVKIDVAFSMFTRPDFPAAFPYPDSARRRPLETSRACRRSSVAGCVPALPGRPHDGGQGFRHPVRYDAGRAMPGTNSMDSTLISRQISPRLRTRTPSTFPSREHWPCDHRLVGINANTSPRKRFLITNHLDQEP